MTDLSELKVARFGGQWHAWSEQLSEWLPLPLTPEASAGDVKHFYAHRGMSVRIVAGR
ncbi:hypothetical protein RM780_09825 [Streptomyces sp. DSM 44917]|uniref:Uncharacterized protein n=1 Tax=Streptomyces boetiae TaxID=3075541 RepID=A0ABU2L6W2_9ACTN|nr:hypothetical protein [Streptomyces sp. DSM 44917]MDT0307260.1 hypothetical protein [Streptomyces sp. DSM 44917]